MGPTHCCQREGRVGAGGLSLRKAGKLKTVTARMAIMKAAAIKVKDHPQKSVRCGTDSVRRPQLFFIEDVDRVGISGNILGSGGQTNPGQGQPE